MMARRAAYERAVHYYETDRMDCVHHSNYIRWFEEARGFLMREGGFPYEEMEALGVVSPVLAVRAEYRSMARYGDTVVVETELAEYTGVRARFAYTVRDKATGALRCAGETNHCFLDREGRPVSLKKRLPAFHEKLAAAMREA